MNTLLLLAGALALGIALVAALAVWLIRSPAARAAMPVWPARDWRAMFALVGSIVGAGILTWFAWWLTAYLAGQADRLISELVRDPHVRPEVGGVLITIVGVLAWGLKLLLAGVIAVILSLGLAINRRTVKLGRTGFEASGGDDGPSDPALAGAAAGAVAGAVAGDAAGKDPQP